MNCASSKNARKSSKKADKPSAKRASQTTKEKVKIDVVVDNKSVKPEEQINNIGKAEKQGSSFGKADQQVGNIGKRDKQKLQSDIGKADEQVGNIGESDKQKLQSDNGKADEQVGNIGESDKQKLQSDIGKADEQVGNIGESDKQKLQSDIGKADEQVGNIGESDKLKLQSDIGKAEEAEMEQGMNIPVILFEEVGESTDDYIEEAVETIQSEPEEDHDEKIYDSDSVEEKCELSEKTSAEPEVCVVEVTANGVDAGIAEGKVMFGIEEDVDEETGPFSEYVDMISVNESLMSCEDDADDGPDMQAGEEVIVQYLKKGDKKLLKMTLRSARWQVKHDIRQVLWYHMCRHLHKADEDDMFSVFAEEIFPSGETPESSDLRVPAFVDPSHINSYHLNTAGIEAAKKILCVIEHSCPDIIHSPMVFALLSLFLHYMDVKQCYSCVYALLRHTDCAFLTTTKVSYEASKFVIRDLAKKYAKAGYVNLVRSCGNIDQVFDSWLWWILEDLPLHYLVHVIDCFLHEGMKVFYRITLAILIHFHKANSKKSTVSPKKEGSSVIASLRQFCREMPVTVDKLFKTGFGIRGLTRKEIRKLQVKHEMYITSKNKLASINEEKTVGLMTISRSFSGPIVLQNLKTSMLTSDMLYAIWTWLPTRYAVCQPELLYTSEEHGTSLVTLYQRVENHQPTIIVIKTTNDEVFGAFCSAYWSDRRQKSHMLSYFGTGETFIFTLYPQKKKYDWVGLTEENIPNTANMFQAGDRTILTVGGGHGVAIALDENMLHCRSEKCDTFNNQPLSESEDFNCKVVEVYGFQH